MSAWVANIMAVWVRGTQIFTRKTKKAIKIMYDIVLKCLIAECVDTLDASLF